MNPSFKTLSSYGKERVPKKSFERKNPRRRGRRMRREKSIYSHTHTHTHSSTSTCVLDYILEAPKEAFMSI
jgi:hypothetical protein